MKGLEGERGGEGLNVPEWSWSGGRGEGGVKPEDPLQISSFWLMALMLI